MTELYLAGRNISIISDIDGKKSGNVWEFIGVFDDKQKAISACVKEDDFITPITLNEFDNGEGKDWKETEYPLLKGNLK